MSHFEHLLSPIQVGSTELRNRVIMGSMHTGLEDKIGDLPKLAAYFAERAKGGIGLAITGGYAPNWRGWLKPLASEMSSTAKAKKHRVVTDAVHEHEGKIALQILHAGRYGYSPFKKGVSKVKSPITPFALWSMSTREVERTVNDFAKTATLAQKAGYDGVEIMGSEGYLINQFLAARTNDRSDKWGGSAQARMRFPLEVARRVRESTGEDFMMIYRISLLDLVDNSQSWEETVELALGLQEAGVDLFNTGIGWHEARIPTIVTSVPPGAFSWVSAKLKQHVSVPVAAANRINTPELAEKILANGEADMVSMARPLLADPEFVAKAAAGQSELINTCIACNQACLDHTFANKKASCLVNPRAGRETTLVLSPTKVAKRVAVIGAGPAGLAAAVELAGRGHKVELFEGADQIGGQFRLAMSIPGKEDFAHTLRYYQNKLNQLKVPVHVGAVVGVEDVQDFDEVVLATGVTPRIPDIEGVDHPSVLTYQQVIRDGAAVGNKVAVLGAGGIGFDVSEFLVHSALAPVGPAAHLEPQPESVEEFNSRWGVVDPEQTRGGLGVKVKAEPKRQVTLLQRKSTTVGKGLAKTSGWVHRATLKDAGVTMVPGVSYERIDDQGLHISVHVDEHTKESRVLEVDTVVLCTGQESVRDLLEPLQRAGISVHVIGGADVAAELDAKRAIKQATELAAAL